MINNEYVSVKTAKQLLGVSAQTLRNWDREGKVRTTRNNGGSGHRLFNKEDICSLTSCNFPVQEKRKVAYCRVSSKKQDNDLKRQQDFFKHEYPDYDLVTDIGSGLNWKRKGFKAILEQAMRRELGVLLVKHRDRLCRFAFELVRFILESNGVELVVLEDFEDESGAQELADDILSIVHVYSCRQMGKRRYTVQANQVISG